jgi:ATP-dependent Lhr-like helicase
LDLFLPTPDEADPSPLLASLRADPRGRTLADLCVDGDRPSVETIAEVWRLAGAGLITSSTFETVRRRILGHFKDVVPRPAQSPNRRRGFARNIAHEGTFRALPEPAPGTPMDRALLETDRCRLLFSRYGVLFRDLLERELPLLRWPRVLQALRMMELSGEIVAGHFFADIPGLQFATPKALTQLEETDPAPPVLAMNACDPASPCGLGLPAFAHFPKRLPSNTLVLKGAELLLVLSRGGKDVRAHIPPDHPDLPLALGVFRQFLDRQFHPEPAIAVETINGEKAPSSPYAPALRAFGFRPDYLSLTLGR